MKSNMNDKYCQAKTASSFRKKSDLPSFIARWLCSPSCDLTASEYKVLLFVLEETLCSGRKCHQLSNRYIQDHTGVFATNVSRALKSLEKKGLVRCAMERKVRRVFFLIKPYGKQEFDIPSLPILSHPINDRDSYTTDKPPKNVPYVPVVPGGFELSLPLWSYPKIGDAPGPEMLANLIPICWNFLGPQEPIKIGSTIFTDFTPTEPKEEVKKEEEEKPKKKTSTLEERVVSLLVRLNLPPAHRHYRFAPGRKFEADFAYPEKKLIIEADGGKYQFGEHHTPEGLEYDRQRSEIAKELGWTVLRADTDGIDGDDFAEALLLLLDSGSASMPEPVILPRCESSDGSAGAAAIIRRALPPVRSSNRDISIWVCRNFRDGVAHFNYDFNAMREAYESRPHEPAPEPETKAPVILDPVSFPRKKRVLRNDDGKPVVSALNRMFLQEMADIRVEY